MNYPVCKFIKRLIRCNIDKIYITICNFYWLIFTWMNIFPSVCHAMAIKAKASFKLFLTDIIYLPLYLHVSWMDGWHRASLSVLGTICYFLIKKKKRKITKRDNWHFYQPKYLLQSQDETFCTNHTIFDIFFCSSGICLIFDGDQFVFSISVWNLVLVLHIFI